MRVLHVEGTGPVFVNTGDYDVVVFHTRADKGYTDAAIRYSSPLPDETYPDLLQVRVIEDDPKLRHEKISARQSWRDPWPGRHR